jgi:hypothetical protein
MIRLRFNGSPVGDHDRAAVLCRELVPQRERARHPAVSRGPLGRTLRCAPARICRPLNLPTGHDGRGWKNQRETKT